MASENAQQALNLARMGIPLRTIAKQLYADDADAALADVSELLAGRVDYDLDSSARLDLERIEFALMASADALRQGDPKAIDSMLRLMDRRDRIRAKAERREGPGPIRSETDAAIAAAKDQLTDMDKGALAALQRLADQVDYLVDHDWQSPKGSLDNVTLPMYFQACQQLGLTPAARARRERTTGGAKPAAQESTGPKKQSKVLQMRQNHQRRGESA